MVEFLSYGDSITPASGSVGSLDGISSESIAQIDEVADGHALQLVRIDSDPTRPSDEPHWVDRSVPSPGYLNPNLLSAWVDVKVYDTPTVVGETLYIRGNFDADGSHDPPSWEEASSHQLGWRDACSCWAGGFKWWLNQTLEYKMYIARPSSDDGWEGGLNRQLYLTSTDDFFLVINDWQN